MKRKIKTIISLIVLFAITTIVLGLLDKVTAADLSDSANITALDIDDLLNYDNMYCVHHGQLLDYSRTYYRRTIITITGNDVYFYQQGANTNGQITGKIKEGSGNSSEANNILAAILYNGGGYGDSTDSYTDTQLGLWQYWDTWVSSSGAGSYGVGGSGYSTSTGASVLSDARYDSQNYEYSITIHYLRHVTDATQPLIAVYYPDRYPKIQNIDVTVTKKWEDNNNAYGNRPTSLNVYLYNSNGDRVDTATMTGSATANTWTYTFYDLQDDVYYAEEASITGYGYKSPTYNGLTITNKLATTSVKVTKKWDDNNNQDDLRKPVTVTLYETIEGTKKVSTDASGNKRTGTLSTTDSSTYTFSNLPTHKNGKSITYTVEENVPDKYTVSYSGNGTPNVTITNTHIPKNDISVTKVWNDCDNRDVKRPNSVEVTLYANGVEKETVELNSSNSWKHTFEDLPSSENGTEINYTVKEKSVPAGYTTTIKEEPTNTYTITNTYEPEKTQVKVTKKWDDNENEDGQRPSAVTVVLYANGKATNNTVTLSEKNNWTATFKDLYKNQDGAEIEYTVQEAKETDAFTQVDGTTLENGKVIKDANGNEFVWVEVPKNTTVYSSSTLNLNLDELTGTALTNAYNAIESDLQNYVSAYRKDGYSDIHSGDDTYLGITNEQYTTLKQKMLKSIFKNGGFYVGRYETGIYGGWRTETGATGHIPVIKKDAYPYNRVSISQAQSLASSLGTTDYRSSLMFGIQWDLMLKYLQTKGVSEADLLTDSTKWGNTRNLERNITSTTAHYTTDFGINWSKTPFNKTSADRIILTAGADELFYKQNISDLAGNLHEMTLEFNSATNNHVTRGSYHGSTSTWAVNNTAARQNSTKDAGNDGKGFRVTLFKDEDIVYAPVDYATTITGDAETGYIITNTYATEKTEIEVKKEWEDYNNQDGIRPTSVTVTLYKNGTSTGKTATLSANNGWTAKFENLNKYENGKEADYTVEEKVPDGYIVDIRKNEDGQIIVTNSHTPERIDIDVNKLWNGDGDVAHETRPYDIEVILCKNGKETDKSLILSNDNGWTGTFEDLYKYENGKLIEYSIKEIEVKGYVSHITGNSTIGFTITNTLQDKPISEGIVITNEHIPEKVSVTVKKEWDDLDDLDGLRRPLTITLYEKTIDDIEPRISKDENGNARTITLTEPNWEGKFENLYKYEYKGKLITYSVKEEKFEPYETTYSEPSYDDNGNITIKVTNKYEPQYDGYVELTGIVWMDGFGGKSNDIDGVLGDNYSLVEDGNVKIRLLDGNGNLIKSTYSDENGELKRTDYAKPSKTDGTYTIRINYDNSKKVYKLYEDKVTVDKKLENAYVEFEYDGMKYTTVRQATTGANTSKAKENVTQRNNFDNEHSTVISTTPHPDQWTDREITAVTNKINTYEKGSIEKREETIKYCYGNGFCDRTQSKDPTQVLEGVNHTCGNCPKEEHEIKCEVEVEKIPNINLGLFEREQPDVALFSDISKVDVEMNGQRYTYLYGVRSNNPEFVSDIQAKFQNKDTYTYKRPVNPADVAYIDKVNANAMEVYVTYEIKVANLSSTLLVEIDEIVNAYDENYDIVSVKKGGGDVTYNSEKVYSSNGFNQIKLTGLNIHLEGENQATINDTIQIRYRIKQEKLMSLFNNEPPINNASEILSYSTKYGATTLYAEQRPYEGNTSERQNQPYGGYDYNSHPGNAGIFINTENRLEATKSEDDTDIAPAFVLCKDSELKALSGTVWEDADVITDDEERLGNGYIDTNEKTVQNVKVELFEKSEDGTIKNAQLYDESGNAKDITESTVYSQPDGSYILSGVVTGKEYFARFTYGNEDSSNITKIDNNDVNARNHKSTIITDPIIIDIMDDEYNTSFDKNWLLKHTDNYSVAVDNMKDRLNIESLKYDNFDDGVNMTAYTKPFIVQLEFDEIDESSNVVNDATGDNVVSGKIEDVTYNNLEKLDFGIIERPREDLVVQKTITNFKITLANGQELTGGNPSESNSDIPYTKTMGFVKFTTIQQARLQAEKQLLIEMDTELIQGAKLEVEYAISVLNNNEVDYDYETNYTDIIENIDVNQFDKYITKNPVANYYYYGHSKTNSQPELSAQIQIVDYLNRELNFDQSKNTGWEPVENVDSLKTLGYISEGARNAIKEYGYKAVQTAEIDGSRTISIARKGEFISEKMFTYKTLANKDENAYDNQIEIIEIDGKTARTVKGKDESGNQLIYKPGNYEPGLKPDIEEADDDRVKVIITPPTGITTYIITYVTIGLAGLVVIACGVIFIKKKVLLKEERR